MPIRAWHEHLNLTQEEVARAFGINASQLEL